MQPDRQTKLEQAEHHSGTLIINIGFVGYAINFAMFGYYCWVDQLYVILAANVVVATAFGLAKILRRKISGYERPTAVGLMLLAVISGIPSFYSVRDHVDLTVRAATMVTMALLAMAVVAGCPDYRRRFYRSFTVIVGTCLVISALAAQQVELSIALAVCSTLIGYVMKKFIDVQVHRHIELVEMREELILVKAEEETRLERASWQREMELARKIQNSIKTPSELTTRGNFIIRSYQIPCNDVAGDWLAVRETPGETIALVADASGKGMQASLVIHAIQSLWAASLDDDTFDAAHWIRQANRILFNLGQSELHVVTLGLIVISDHQLTYYGCGHPPLASVVYENTDKESMPAVRYHMGKGDILGLKKDLCLQPVVIDLPVYGSVDILLGTDGVMDGKLLRKKTLVPRFIEQLRTEGEKAVAEYDAFDDKTLIWLHREAEEIPDAHSVRWG